MSGTQQPLEGIQILLVEDEPDVASLLLLILQMSGATVEHYIQAETALLALESSSPNILVSNIMLPIHDGMWLIQQIRNHPRSEIQRLPAIGVTSYDRDVYPSHVLESGFDYFLSKLDSPDIMIEVIASLAVLSQ